MWNKGRTAIITSAPPLPDVSQSTAWQALVTRLAWVSIAPLDVPVVPPVYCRQAISDEVRPLGDGVRERPRITSQLWIAALREADPASFRTVRSVDVSKDAQS